LKTSSGTYGATSSSADILLIGPEQTGRQSAEVGCRQRRRKRTQEAQTFEDDAAQEQHGDAWGACAISTIAEVFVAIIRFTVERGFWNKHATPAWKKRAWLTASGHAGTKVTFGEPWPKVPIMTEKGIDWRSWTSLTRPEQR
jgi:hypothetical protein